jgi:hypothetical protein
MPVPGAILRRTALRDVAPPRHALERDNREIEDTLEADDGKDV